MGGIAGEASAEELDALRAYGRHTGLAFQIIDDVLDVVGDEAKLGKHVGADEEHDKATAVAVYGLDEARGRAASLVEHAVTALNVFGSRGALLTALANEVVARES